MNRLKMNLLCKIFLYFTSVVPLTLIFQAGIINCYPPNQGSYGRYSPTNYSPPEKMCNGYRLYFNHTRKCYHPNLKGPCGERMILETPKQSPNSKTGECICESACNGRPMVNIPGENRCYFIFEQGPCPSGQWLVPLSEDVTVCEPIPCPERYDALPKPFNFNKKFLFSYKGQCYMTGVEGAGPCPANEAAYIYAHNQALEHICSTYSQDCEFSFSGAEHNKCEDGTIPDEFGGCEPSTVL